MHFNVATGLYFGLGKSSLDKLTPDMGNVLANSRNFSRHTKRQIDP